MHDGVLSSCFFFKIGTLLSFPDELLVSTRFSIKLYQPICCPSFTTMTQHRQQKMVCVLAMGGASCLHDRPRLEGTVLGEIKGEFEAEMGIVMIIFHQTAG